MLDATLITLVPIAALVRLILSRHHSLYFYLIGLVYVYAVAPYILYLSENPFYLRFCQTSCLFDLNDLRFGLVMIILMLFPLIIIEFLICRKPACTKKVITKINKLYFGQNLYYFYYFFYFLNIVGIFFYGISDFFSSYTNAESNKIGSLSWSIMTNSFFLLAVLYGIIGTKSKIINYSFLFLLCFYLIGGARLVPVMSLLYLFALWYGPTFKMTSKLLLTLILFCLTFVLLGVFRSSSNDLLILANGYLEFGFVTTGYYNAIAEVDLQQLNLFEFFNNTFRFLPFFPFNEVEDTRLIKDLFGSEKLFSPVGGSYVISSLFIYFGFFAYVIFLVLVVLLMLFDWNSGIKFLENPTIKNQIVRSFFVFLTVFALINLIRNNYYSFVSISAKSIVIHLFLLINCKRIK